jgi:hypothetical protein
MADPFKSPGDQTIPGPNGTITGTGDVTQPPPVPGGSEHPGKGVTAVNTAAMKTFAANLASLAEDGGPLTKLLTYVGSVNVKPGGFHAAQDSIVEPVVGSGKLKEQTVQMVHDLIDSINTTSEKMAAAALAYETADEANKMSTTDFANYFGQVTTDINQIGSKGTS